MAPNDDESVKLFLSIGLDEKTATTTINNPKVTANLTAVIHEAGVTNGCDRTTGNLLYTVRFVLISVLNLYQCWKETY
ncbi:glutamine--tRNA ligase, cytoplasmic-like [Brassica napus]|uniref:glutamine--tRNA ligase, cytoplasmic-like n=1 Tax=Brassica napus TaxID=3708 RepID=UPI00207A5D64|nr:glutamine--tRNA ligase, cytoplasmic-like [Brassica napus]